MRTSEEILEKYLSEDSVDIFGAQRLALLGLLPFNLAKPYLHPQYVSEHESGNLLVEEMWVENIDLADVIVTFLPEVYKSFDNTSELEAEEGILFLKSWVWALNDGFYDILAPYFDKEGEYNEFKIVKLISQHFNYTPDKEYNEFEELESEDPQISEEELTE